MAGPIAGSRRGAGGWLGSGPLSGRRRSTGGSGPSLPIAQGDVTGLPEALSARPTRQELDEALLTVPQWSTNNW